MNKPLFPDVVVNDEVISAAQVSAEAQNHAAPQGKPGKAWQAAARALVIRSLMLQEADRLGLQPDPKEVARGKVETPDEALIRQAMELGVETVEPTQTTIESIYAANPERFRAPSLFEPAHILFVADPKDTDLRTMAKTRATAALKALDTAPNQFAQLAKELSDCPSREAGGRLGQIVSGDTVQEFEAALANMQPGEICPKPVESRYGFHVVRLDAKSVGDVLPLSAVQSQIAETLEKAGWAQAAKSFVNRLVDEAKISGIDMTVRG